MSEDNNFYIRPSEAEDIMYLKDNLRQADIEEITATGSNPLVSLCEGYIFSQECYTCIYNDKPSGMFGLSYFGDKQGSIWFLGTDDLQKVPKEWLICGRQYINHFLEIYPILSNMVSIDNRVHIRWLKHLGAIFSAPYEVNGNLFRDFYFLQPSSKPNGKATNGKVKCEKREV